MKRILSIVLFLSVLCISARRDFNLQAAIDATPNGGTVLVPRGIWEGDAVIPEGKYIHIQGVSPAMIGQSPPLGNPQWDYLLTSYPQNFVNGSILRGHITATGNAAKLSMTNVIMIGHGEGTAVTLGDGASFAYGGTFDNVDFGNYETAIDAKKVYNLTVNKSRIYGTGTALKIYDSNLVRLRDVDIISCTLGAELRGEILWQGGSVQECNDGIHAYLTAGSLGSIHFEGINGASLYLDGYGSDIGTNFFASNSGTFVVNGYNNIIRAGWVISLELTAKSQGNIVLLSGGPYIDNGWQNNIITRYP